MKVYITKIEIMTDESEHAERVATIEMFDDTSHTVTIKDRIMSADELHEVADVLASLEWCNDEYLGSAYSKKVGKCKG